MDKSKIRILAVDDEKDILDAIRTHLEMDGYHVDITSSASEALEMIGRRSYHIVLTDINMPGIDGLELLEKIKADHGATIVIMITAYSSITKVLNSRMHGAADYLLKPFRDLGEIDEVISRACQSLVRWDNALKETRKIKQNQ